jgi:hypothetical protein
MYLRARQFIFNHLSREMSMKRHDSTPEYFSLRDKLQRLHLAPVPDQVAIARVIDALAKVQLRVKYEQTGIKGNNPNE